MDANKEMAVDALRYLAQFAKDEVRLAAAQALLDHARQEERDRKWEERLAEPARRWFHFFRG